MSGGGYRKVELFLVGVVHYQRLHTVGSFFLAKRFICGEICRVEADAIDDRADETVGICLDAISATLRIAAVVVAAVLIRIMSPFIHFLTRRFKVFEQSHPHINSRSELYHPTSATIASQKDLGRTDLRYSQCGAASYRPKFICIRPLCRRQFKPFFDAQKLEVEISRSGWRVRPNPEADGWESEILRAGLRRKRGRAGDMIWLWDEEWSRVVEVVKRAYGSRDKKMPMWLRQRIDEREALDQQSLNQNECESDGKGADEKEQPDEHEHEHEQPDEQPVDQADQADQTDQPITDSDLTLLKRLDPELWWLNIVDTNNNNTTTTTTTHLKRCPGCGSDGIRVGSNFEVPAKTDEKGWQRVQRMLDEGVDMVATFESCSTVDEYNEMVVEAKRREKMRCTSGGWEEEKRRRLVDLGVVKGVAGNGGGNASGSGLLDDDEHEHERDNQPENEHGSGDEMNGGGDDEDGKKQDGNVSETEGKDLDWVFV